MPKIDVSHDPQAVEAVQAGTVEGDHYEDGETWMDVNRYREFRASGRIAPGVIHPGIADRDEQTASDDRE